MKNNEMTRRELLQRMGLTALGWSLLSLLPVGCTRPNRHPDQQMLRNGCTDCGKCRCPYGVDIAKNLSLYNELATEGRLPDPREGNSEHYRSDCQRFLDRLNRIPRLAQADRCISCQKCLSQCPEQVDIPRALHQMESLIQKVKDDGTMA